MRKRREPVPLFLFSSLKPVNAEAGRFIGPPIFPARHFTA